MDGDEGPSGDGIGKLSQRLSERAVVPGGEVDYKTKAGTAWSHSFLNQKPWHPLSYPNQRRKWIAEQTHANRERRADEVAREFAQEQEFFRQTALFSKKEKEKVEMLKAVSFMYVRPPGYNAESAKAAEVADEKKRLDQNIAAEDGTNEATPAMPEVRLDSGTHRDKKARPKDVFGRALPTEEEFEVLKNAPRIDTGVAGRVKPFAVEIRNVRCVRCGAFGHQSGDRECPLKDAIMPNEESRLKRDDPLTAMMAQTDSSEPLKWELKQKPGMSPPRGGYQADDPNQQIVADDTIFDEYGGFLSGGDIPALLSNFTTSKPKKRSKHKSKHKDHHKSKVRHMNQSLSSESEDDREMYRKHKGRHKSRVRHRNQSSSSESEDESEMNLKHKDHHKSMVRHRNQSSSSESGDDMEMNRRSRSKHKKKSSEFEEDREMNPRSSSKHKSFKSEDDVEMMNWRSRSKHKKNSESECDMEINRRSRSKHRKKNQSSSSESEDDGEKNQRSRSKHKRYNSSSSELEDDREKNKKRSRNKHREQKKQRHVESSAPDSFDSYHHRHHQRRRHAESIAPDSSDSHHHRHRREHGYHSDSTPYSSGSPHHPRRNQHR